MSLDHTASLAAPPMGGGPGAGPVAGLDRLPVPWGVSRPWVGARTVPLDATAVAVAWRSAVARGDWMSAWASTDGNLRLASAQQWLDRLGRTGDNVTAWSLAAEVPHLGMWAPFAGQLFGRWADDLELAPCRSGDGTWVSGRSEDHRFGRDGRWGVGRELSVVRMGSAVAPRHLTLRLRDRWRVAGIGRGVAQPGWPARWIPLESTDTDAAAGGVPGTAVGVVAS